jgi:AraC-like DNA-binding protein
MMLEAPRIHVELAEAQGMMMPFVDPYFTYRNEAVSFDGIDRVDMGRIHFALEGSGYRTFPNGDVAPSSPVMISPPATAASTHHLDGPYMEFGMSLRAIGWKALVGLPAHKFANRLINGVDIFGPEVLDLHAQLQRQTRLEDMIALVEPFLLARRRPVPKAHLALARAVREWTVAGEPGIEGFFARVDMSRRQATRLCNEYYGGPPKLLERKFRAIRAAIRIYQGWDPNDAAAPFSDQPHMIKEIKHFTGHTPSILREGIDPVVAMTLDYETFDFMPAVIPEAVDAVTC